MAYPAVWNIFCRIYRRYDRTDGSVRQNMEESKGTCQLYTQHANVHITGSNTDNLQQNGGTSMPEATRTSKVTRIMFVVTFWFFFSFVPHMTVVMLELTVPNFRSEISRAGYMAFQIAYRSPMLNTASNAIIYTCMDNKFRQELKRFCYRRNAD